jgi:hypothetical protein
MSSSPLLAALLALAAPPRPRRELEPEESASQDRAGAAIAPARDVQDVDSEPRSCAILESRAEEGR